MRTLQRISVSGYKSIKQQKDLEIRQLNVLVGANGAGKSNFISLLMLRSQRLMIALDAFFVPEAQRTLAGGGAWRNHRKREPDCPRPEGTQD
jgi:predicted ATP-binding protein involved in virulence